jgi:amino-acid N-acetyltransferase
MRADPRRQTHEAPESRMSVIRPRPSLAAAKALLATADLPVADLTDGHCEHFFYWGPPDAPTGLVGLELFGDVALLRSLTVSPETRSSGMGSALVRYAENHALSQGVRTLFLLTTTAEGFFARLGYSNTARDAAPPSIRSTREFAGICPASSAFMSKQLRERS